ncbi:Uncharacterised protein [Shigella sonnei]|nr:Uncharacterised protein [Shigella sonnei]
MGWQKCSGIKRSYLVAEKRCLVVLLVCGYFSIQSNGLDNFHMHG